MISDMPTLSITLPDDINDLDDEALQNLRERADVLSGKLYMVMRDVSTLLEAKSRQDALNAEVLNASGINIGDAWRQPTGAHDAYPRHMEVTHKSKTWESLIAGNVWEPGVSGWREKVEETAAAPEWIQPTGGHDAYSKGTAVSFEGSEYESLIDGNTWSPTAHPAGWKKLEAAA